MQVGSGETVFSNASGGTSILRDATGNLIEGRKTVDDVRYFHLLFDKHTVLRAGGIAVESLFLGDVGRGWINSCRVERRWNEIDPAATDALVHRRTALPCLRRFEAQTLFSLDARFAPIGDRVPVAA